MIQCRQIMTPDPTSCEPTATIDQVARLMKEKDVGPVPVVDNQDHRVLVGIVTDRDLAVNAVAHNDQPSKTEVARIMSTNPVCCKPEDDIEEALELMRSYQLRRIPIVDEQKRLVGIISQGDIANRLGWSDKTAQVVEEVSKPSLLEKEDSANP